MKSYYSFSTSSDSDDKIKKRDQPTQSFLCSSMLLCLSVGLIFVTSICIAVVPDIYTSLCECVDSDVAKPVNYNKTDIFYLQNCKNMFDYSRFDCIKVNNDVTCNGTCYNHYILGTSSYSQNVRIIIYSVCGSILSLSVFFCIGTYIYGCIKRRSECEY